MGSAVVFWVLAVVLLASAAAVVFFRNIFRAALSLVLCFFAVAGLYILLQADFLAAVQVLIYAGAIAILIIFAIMMTPDAQRANPWSRYRFPALALVGLTLAVFIAVLVTTDWQSKEVITGPTTDAIATSLFDKEKGFVLPFEVASVLLLAAVLGAIALVRGRD